MSSNGRVSWAGSRAVAATQLRHRRRTTRWVRALLVWCGVLAGVLLVAVALLPWLLPSVTSYSGTAAGPGSVGQVLGFGELEVTPGPTLFAVVTFTMLAGAVVAGATLTATAPAVTAAPADRALGTWLASWICTCGLVAAGVPFLVLTLVAGGGPPSAVVRVTLVVALLAAGVCGVAEGLATAGRAPTRVVRMTVGAVLAVTLVTPVLVAIANPLVTTTGPVQVYTVLPSSPANTDNPTCGYEPAVRRIAHTERSWWVQVVNPVVLVADAAGTPDPGPMRRSAVAWPIDPLDGIRRGARLLRAGSPLQLDECASIVSDEHIEQSVATGPFWGWGVAFWTILGAVGVVLAARRQPA